MTYKEQQEEELDLLEKKMERERSKAEALQEDITFKTKIGIPMINTLVTFQHFFFHFSPAKGVYRTLFLSKPPEKNEHFFPGRMVCTFCIISW